VKGKVNSLLIIFIDIKGTVHEKFILAGHTVKSAITVTYSDCMKMCKDFALNVGDKRLAVAS
jgi:hypothetical protein